MPRQKKNQELGPFSNSNLILKLSKNDFFADCLDCVLTTHKVHNMLPFQVNISIISLFICKKPEKKDKSPIISKHDFYKKSFT